jgi:hemin uptake protein HemP
MSDLHLPSNPTSSSLSSRASSVVRVRSDDLLRGTREIVIEHRGEEYRLLRTRNDRLILNK